MTYHIFNCIVIKPPFLRILIFLFFYCHSVFSQSNGRYRSFEFQQFEVTVLSPYQKIHATQENIDFIQSSIQSELESQGLRLQESPDLFINIKMTMKQEVQARDPTFNDSKDSQTPYTNSENVPIKLQGGITVKLERSLLSWRTQRKT